MRSCRSEHGSIVNYNLTGQAGTVAFLPGQGARFNITGNSMPRPTTAVMPTMTGTARALAVESAERPFEPLDLARPLPSIVNTEIVDMRPPACDGLTQWVSDNPLLAAGVLIGAAVLLWRKG